MISKSEGVGARACWFVGATYDGTDDQTPRFLRDGIWENGHQDKYLDAVKSIQVGDRIAIKSTYTQEGNGDPLAENASGLLLHPSVGNMVSETVVIQNHEIRFVTVDLGATAKEIRMQLLHAVEKPCERQPNT
jgi:hypothetical protein